MPEETSNHPFSEAVLHRLSDDSRELWAPLADTFNREGPESVKTYLENELERLGARVRSLFEDFQAR